MKKVCHILDSLSVGGLEKTVVAIATGLAGYEHHVWCLQRKGPLAAQIEDHGMAVKEFRLRGGMTVSGVAQLVGAMRRGRFAIVHGHGIYPAMWARTAAFAAGIPVKIAHTQSLYLDPPFRLRLKLRSLAMITTRLIAVSDAVRDSLIRDVGISADKIDVIYNSAPDMLVRDGRVRAALRDDLGVGDAFTVLGVGRLDKIKGHCYLIEAVKACADKGINVHCLLAGDGPYRGVLVKRADELGVSCRVRFLGTRDDIAPLLAAADALVQPSVLREGLPLALAEGASAGLPLIATSVGGNSEVVIDGRTGFLVPSMDAQAIAGKIALLAGDREEARRMGGNARTLWRSTFSRERMLLRIRELYDRCFGSGPSGRGAQRNSSG